MKKEANIKNEKNKKEETEKTNKFAETIKKKWLIDSSKTILLLVIILAFFIGVTVFMQKLQLGVIDLTEEKLFSLTEESKEQIRNINIENEVNIYFIGYQDIDTTLDLARQYTKAR